MRGSQKTGSRGHCTNSVSQILVRDFDETIWNWGELQSAYNRFSNPTILV